MWGECGGMPVRMGGVGIAADVPNKQAQTGAYTFKRGVFFWGRAAKIGLRGGRCQSEVGQIGVKGRIKTGEKGRFHNWESRAERFKNL